MKRAAATPRFLLSVRSLSGSALVTRDRSIELLTRFREPETLAVTISKALDAGMDGVLANPTPLLKSALSELKRRVPVYAVLPALTEHERNELAPGIESVLARAHASNGIANGARRTFGGVLKPALIYGGDWVARMRLMIETEAAPIPRRDLAGVVLDAWLTDLALATGHRKLFESFCRTVRRMPAAAGFETQNLGTLLARLREWKIQPDLVVGPINPRGLLMKPTPEEALEELARAESPVIAKDLRAGGAVTLEEGARYAFERKAWGVAPDLSELEDVGAEMKRLKKLTPEKEVKPA
jgi:hypothetical protein